MMAPSLVLLLMDEPALLDVYNTPACEAGNPVKCFTHGNTQNACQSDLLERKTYEA